MLCRLFCGEYHSRKNIGIKAWDAMTIVMCCDVTMIVCTFWALELWGF